MHIQMLEIAVYDDNKLTEVYTPSTHPNKFLSISAWIVISAVKNICTTNKRKAKSKVIIKFNNDATRHYVVYCANPVSDIKAYLNLEKRNTKHHSNGYMTIDEMLDMAYSNPKINI
jgi:hypothetical protein